MKLILQDKNNFILRFDKDEEVVEGLQKFMGEQGITACSFSGIGASSTAEIAFYNPFTKQYRSKPYVEELEIVSLIGNGAIMDSKPVLHAHGSFAKNDFTVIGGHVNKLIVGVVCEITLLKLEGVIQRQHDADTNLSSLI